MAPGARRGRRGAGGGAGTAAQPATAHRAAGSGRRGPRLAITGPELDDLAYQRPPTRCWRSPPRSGSSGESRFTTWAYKFVIFEVSAKIGRHFWRHPAVPLSTEQWERLPARSRLLDPARESEWRDWPPACAGPWTQLTPRQREVFVGAEGQPASPQNTLVLVAGLQPQRHRQVMLRRAGASCGPLLPLTGSARSTLRGADERLAAYRSADGPAGWGCAQAMEVLHPMPSWSPRANERENAIPDRGRPPGVGPCGEDLRRAVAALGDAPSDRYPNDSAPRGADRRYLACTT